MAEFGIVRILYSYITEFQPLYTRDIICKLSNQIQKKIIHKFKPCLFKANLIYIVFFYIIALSFVLFSTDSLAQSFYTIHPILALLICWMNHEACIRIEHIDMIPYGHGN